MNQEQEIAWAKADAEAKIAAIPAREAELFGDAIKEGRKPFALTPHTALRTSTLKGILDRIKQPGELGQVIKAQRKSCESAGDMEVALLSADVLALIKAGESSGDVPRQ